MVYTKRVTYSKEFLTGTLAGIVVREAINTTDDAVVLHERALGAMQRAYVLDGKAQTDLTGNAYRVYNIGSEDIR